MKNCSYGVNKEVFLMGFRRVIVFSMGKLISKQNPGEPNPLLQMAFNTSHPPT